MRSDETLVEGRSPENAQRLLEAAAKAGLHPSVVRTTLRGYIVPSSLVGEPVVEEPEESPEEEPVEHSTGEPEEQYDPSQHNVDEVEAHLATVDASERERILAAEAAGKARKSLLALIDSEGEK